MSDKFLRLIGANNEFDFILRTLIWLTAIITPLYDIVGAIIVLIIIDFLTGIGASIKLRLRITANRMTNTLSKLLFYFLVILASHITETKLLTAIPLLQIVAGFIAITELKSIFENFNTIFSLNIFQYIRQLFNKDTIEKLLPKNDKNGKTPNS